MNSSKVSSTRERLKTLPLLTLLQVNVILYFDIKIWKGGLAKFTTWFVCHPQDLIKTKLQCNPSYQGIVECSKEVWQRYGSTGFWRGSLPSIIRTLISGAVTFAVYEEAQKFFSEICWFQSVLTKQKQQRNRIFFSPWKTYSSSLIILILTYTFASKIMYLTIISCHKMYPTYLNLYSFPQYLNQRYS